MVSISPAWNRSFHNFPERFHQFAELVGFLQQRVHLLPREAHSDLLLGVAACEEHPYAGLDAAHFQQGLHAVHPRHAEVQQHAVYPVRRRLQRFQA